MTSGSRTSFPGRQAVLGHPPQDDMRFWDILSSTTSCSRFDPALACFLLLFVCWNPPIPAFHSCMPWLTRVFFGIWLVPISGYKPHIPTTLVSSTSAGCKRWVLIGYHHDQEYLCACNTMHIVSPRQTHLSWRPWLIFSPLLDQCFSEGSTGRHRKILLLVNPDFGTPFPQHSNRVSWCPLESSLFVFVISRQSQCEVL